MSQNSNRIPKTLSSLDRRTLGYFGLLVAITAMFVKATSEGISGWVSMMLACFGMLSITSIASSTDAEFDSKNKWVMPILMIGLGVIPLLITFLRLARDGFSYEADLLALIMPTIAILLFFWYVKNNGVPVRSVREPVLAQQDSGDDKPMDRSGGSAAS